MMKGKARGRLRVLQSSRLYHQPTTCTCQHQKRSDGKEGKNRAANSSLILHNNNNNDDDDDDDDDALKV